MAGKSALQGEIIDLIERMRQALPPEVEVSKADWLEARQTQQLEDDSAGRREQHLEELSKSTPEACGHFRP